MIDWQPSQARVDVAAAKTAELRTSPKPQWADARRRLEGESVSATEAVIAEWHSAGPDAMTGVIVSRDGRVFVISVTYGRDEKGRPLAKGDGWIHRWTMIPPEEVGPTSAGYPNAWAQAKIVADRLFEASGR